MRSVRSSLIQSVAVSAYARESHARLSVWALAALGHLLVCSTRSLNVSAREQGRTLLYVLFVLHLRAWTLTAMDRLPSSPT